MGRRLQSNTRLSGLYIHPPTWSHLRVYVYPWVHGYYHLYSDDDWYNSEYAYAQLDTWIGLYQNFWRSRDYRRRFTYGGSELNPTHYGRIDNQYIQAYYTDVGEEDTVTVRVGVQIYSYARAGGSHSILIFQSGDSNYVYVPYIYWYLYY